MGDLHAAVTAQAGAYNDLDIPGDPNMDRETELVDRAAQYGAMATKHATVTFTERLAFDTGEFSLFQVVTATLRRSGKDAT